MKRFIGFVLVAIMIFGLLCNQAYAINATGEACINKQIITLSNGNYIEITVLDCIANTRGTKTGSTTYSYYSGGGGLLESHPYRHIYL